VLKAWGDGDEQWGEEWRGGEEVGGENGGEEDNGGCVKCIEEDNILNEGETEIVGEEIALEPVEVEIEMEERLEEVTAVDNFDSEFGMSGGIVIFRCTRQKGRRKSNVR